ncbi:hypothetical protein [Agrobacterium sp. NPDC090273]|uniref:hypothetical protein n=1 Tax=Agrobacterium sp. NPDC090273 TaxID=3363919 RepID=UPI00383A687F
MRLLIQKLCRWFEIFAHQRPVTWAIACALIGIWGTLAAAGFWRVAFDSPPDVQGDALFLLLFSKSAILGEGFVNIPFLAFPDGLNFSYFPTFDFTQLFLIKALAQFYHSPFEIWTAFHIAAATLGFCTSYLLFLSLTGSPLQSALLAFCTAFFAYIQRLTGHNFLYADYAVALAVLLIFTLLAKDSIVRSKNTFIYVIQFYVFPPFCLFIVLFSGVYYTFFFLAIFSFLLFYKILTGTIELPYRAVAVIIVSIIIFSVGMFIAYPQILLDPAVFSPTRTAFDQPAAALRIADAALEYSNNRYNPLMPFQSGTISAYAEWRQVIEGFDAFSGPFVTLFALAAPFLVPLSSGGFVKRWFENDRKARAVLDLSAVAILFIILFAVPFGYGFLFSEFITPALRSQNRISPFMNLFAMILLYGFIKYAFKSTSAVVVALIVIVGFNGIGRYDYWAQYYRSITTESALNLQSAQTLVSKMAATPETVVLQLPYANFPEVPDIKNFAPYQHLLLPIVFPTTNADEMPRWSYGSVTAQVASKLGSINIGEPLKTGWDRNAACMGFTDIVVEKRAYDQLPVPDVSLWVLRHEDTLRQLWKRTSASRPFDCANTLALDFRKTDDRMMLYGEDRVWHVDEVGGYLKRSEGKIALPLFDLRQSEICVSVEAQLINRTDRPNRNTKLFLKVGSTQTVWPIESDTASASFIARIGKDDWQGNVMYMTVSQTTADMPWFERVKASYRARKTMIGIQSLQIKPSPCG